MHSEKAATGRHALRPAQDYCHLCPLQRPSLALRHGHPDEPCITLEPCRTPSPVHWREDVPFPFPPVSPIGEDIRDHHDHCISHHRQVHFSPNHYPVSCKACGPPCYSWREVRTSRWDWPPDPRLFPCTCAWARHKDCGCLRPWYPPDLPHHFNGDHMPPFPPPKVRGHRYYRESRYVSEERYWDCTNEGYCKDERLERPEWDDPKTYGHNGHCERRHVTFECHANGDKFVEDFGEATQPASPERTNYNGSPGFFATEVPQSKFWSSRMSASRLRVSGSQDEEPKLGRVRRPEGGLESQKNQRRSQGMVREQIKQVVTELEDVLGGLKQVQLEMKEVVQQIDILTSNIDLGEEDQGSSCALPPNPLQQGNRIGVVALVHNSNGDPELLQRDDIPRPGVKSRTNRFWSDHSLAAAAFPGLDIRAANADHTDSSAVESADGKRMNHTTTTEMHRTKNTANGDCLRARPPRVKVKDLQNLRNRGDHTALSRSSGALVPLLPLGLAKTQRPPPYPQNGQAKMPQDSSHSQNTPKMSPYPAKQKQISTTVV